MQMDGEPRRDKWVFVKCSVVYVLLIHGTRDFGLEHGSNEIKSVEGTRLGTR